jgi:hypothetical protein
MNPRAVIALAAVWVVWTALDFILHTVVLSPVYAATAGPLQPLGDMPMGLMGLNTLVAAACFVALYLLLTRYNKPINGSLYGLLFGVAAGIALGFGLCATLPIAKTLAIIWVLGFTFKSTMAGTVAALILLPPDAEEEPEDNDP